MIDQRQVTCLSFCELHNCDMEGGGANGSFTITGNISGLHVSFKGKL